MKKIKCRLNISTRKGDGHISQVITGFMMLKEQGLIDLDINCSNEYPFVSIVQAIVNDELVVLYDMADGYIFDNEKLNEYAQKADYYFKRSYSEEYNTQLKFTTPIFPLGLNYHVTIKDNILDKPINQNILSKVIWYYKELQGKNYHQNFYVKNFEAEPTRKNNEPMILFTTRTWSTEYDTEESHYIDNMRAECIRSLRKEFGKNFVGGFSARDAAIKNFPDCVLDDSVTNRINFMRLVKDADICISTMGLWGSNGWKLGEYVAASKAIVSERLKYDVTGDFLPEKNYLEFNDTEECVKQTVRLAKDKELMYQIKLNNHHYYQNYLRPDKLILNSLMIVTEEEKVTKIS